MDISRNVVEPGGYPRPLNGAARLKYRKPRNDKALERGRSAGNRYTKHRTIFNDETDEIDCLFFFIYICAFHLR